MISSIRRRVWTSAWKNRTISWRLSLMATIPLMVMAISDYFVSYWYLIFGSIGLTFYFFMQAWRRSPRMQMVMDRATPRR